MDHSAHGASGGPALTRLAVTFVVTVPLNRWLLTRGKGHAVVHGLHGQT